MRLEIYSWSQFLVGGHLRDDDDDMLTTNGNYYGCDEAEENDDENKEDSEQQQLRRTHFLLPDVFEGLSNWKRWWTWGSCWYKSYLSKYQAFRWIVWFLKTKNWKVAWTDDRRPPALSLSHALGRCPAFTLYTGTTPPPWSTATKEKCFAWCSCIPQCWQHHIIVD